MVDLTDSAGRDGVWWGGGGRGIKNDSKIFVLATKRTRGAIYQGGENRRRSRFGHTRFEKTEEIWVEEGG